MGMRPFAVFDIDGTLIRWQLYHAVADELARRGHFDPQQYQTVRSSRMLWKQRDSEDSFTAYESELVALVDAAITGISVTQFTEACQAVLQEYRDQVYTYTRDLTRQLKKKGYLLFAISASQAEIVGLLAKYYGFDDFGGSSYEVKNGVFTGKKQVLKSERKPDYLKELIAKHQATYKSSLGVGDSESDIAMLELVEQPIAYNPTKKLFAHAQKNGWQIAVERKNVIYELRALNGKYVLAQTSSR